MRRGGLTQNQQFIASLCKHIGMKVLYTLCYNYLALCILKIDERLDSRVYHLSSEVLDSIVVHSRVI